MQRVESIRQVASLSDALAAASEAWVSTIVLRREADGSGELIVSGKEDNFAEWENIMDDIRNNRLVA